MITQEQLDRARAVIAGHVHRTPILSVGGLPEREGRRLQRREAVGSPRARCYTTASDRAQRLV
jgi:hypothetical protein